MVRATNGDRKGNMYTLSRIINLFLQNVNRRLNSVHKKVTILFHRVIFLKVNNFTTYIVNLIFI
jgi:hypothetical protein